MQIAARSQQSRAKEAQVATAVGVIEEAGKAIVAALHDVLCNSGKIESGKAGHGQSIARPSNQQHRNLP